MAAWHESTRPRGTNQEPSPGPRNNRIGIGMRRRHHSTGCQQRARAASLATASQQLSKVQGARRKHRWDPGLLVLTITFNSRSETRWLPLCDWFVSFADWLEIEGKMLCLVVQVRELRRSKSECLMLFVSLLIERLLAQLAVPLVP
jgi:hypothetical protein